MGKWQQTLLGASQPGEPRRWWMIQASAVLSSVATQNYVRFGCDGVLTYPLPGPAVVSPSDPERIEAVLIFRAAEARSLITGTETELVIPAIELKTLDCDEHQTTWGGYDRVRHLQVLWVWDFYRIQSHLALRMAKPPQTSAPEVAWQQAFDMFCALQPGDQLVFDVDAATGQIHQVHTLEAAAAAYTPQPDA
ncbi:MAG: hypothetical protein JW966_08470 [Anaerolineae bacterium]|nr:hypothetical protein [Anaerolineae bacterium]